MRNPRSLPRLDQLVLAVENDSPGDVLAQLQVAVGLANRLTTVADDLVEHYVDTARECGEPWARIGDRLGISKQAVQQRFSGAVVTGSLSEEFPLRFPRHQEWDPAVRDAVAAALAEAERLGHSFLGTEHLLLGVLGQSDSLASRFLLARGVDIEGTRRRVTELTAPRGGSGVPCTGVTRRAKRVLDIAHRELRGRRWRRGSQLLTLEHLLLGLALERRGLAARILSEHGVDEALIARQLNAVNVERRERS